MIGKIASRDAVTARPVANAKIAIINVNVRIEWKTCAIIVCAVNIAILAGLGGRIHISICPN
jgi:hypothetical protein